MRYGNMINFIAELRHVAFCRYVILCFSFLVDELSPPEVKKRVCLATHSRLVDILGTEINKYKPMYRHLAETVLKVMALE